MKLNLAQTLRNIDKFSEIIPLRLRGEDERRTTFGGCLSLLMYVILITTFMELSLRVVQRESS